MTQSQLQNFRDKLRDDFYHFAYRLRTTSPMLLSRYTKDSVEQHLSTLENYYADSLMLRLLEKESEAAQ
jgi:hypothetical protein